MADHARQRRADVADVGAISLSDAIFHLKGDVATVLVRPANASMLVLIAEVGDWRVKLGDKDDAMPAAYAVAASVVDGTGAHGLPELESVVITAPHQVTVKGYTANDVLTYYWI